MTNQTRKVTTRAIRKHRIRATVSGTTARPRLTVSISLLHVTAQVIDDTTQRTLAYASTVGTKQTGSLTDKAAWVGEEVAKKAKTAKVTTVVFDRNGRKYHGRVQALADAARKAGLEF